MTPKLSDAIALGSLLVAPAARDEWFADGSGCARGMALEALGQRIPRTDCGNTTRFEQLWPWTLADIENPCGCPGHDRISWVIAHLFDFHVCPTPTRAPWTLEQLIDWVRGQELPEASVENRPEVVENIGDKRSLEMV